MHIYIFIYINIIFKLFFNRVYNFSLIPKYKFSFIVGFK